MAAALFTLTSAAQEKEKQQSNQYRKNKKNTEQLSNQRKDSTMNNADTTSRDMEDVDANPTGREIKKSGENAIQEADSAARQSDENRGEDVQPAEVEMEESTRQIKDDVQRTGGEERRAKELEGEGLHGVAQDSVSNEKMRNEETSQNISQQEGNTGSPVKKGTEQSQMNDEGSTDLRNTMPPATVEVHESKEGPHGEVVYRINDELYYVDQTKQRKLVKANENELKDTHHKVTVKEGQDVSNKPDKKLKKSKG